MSLIMDKCYFCLNKRAEVVVEDVGETYCLCPSCHEQYLEALENSKKSPLELPRQNPSDLCRQCGLCCVVLSARVDEDEVHRMVDQHNATGRHPHDLTFDQMCYKDDYPPYRGEFTMRFPCRMLKGHLLNYVACRAYDLDRPKVCRSYLCKIALSYKFGLISLPEAKFQLRASFLKADIGVFNWTQGEATEFEGRITLISQVAEHVDLLKANDVPEEYWEWSVAQFLTPEYVPSSSLARTMLNMHLANVDRDEFSLEVYDPELAKEDLSERERELVMRTVESVLRELRKLFIRADELGKKVDKEDSDERRAGEGEEGTGGAGQPRQEAREGADQDEAEGGDGGDDLDPGGRGGVDDRRRSARAARGAEGEGDAADAQGEPDQHPATGAGPGPRGADEESGQERTDLVNTKERV